jgi:hypothetical protein
MLTIVTNITINFLVTKIASSIMVVMFTILISYLLTQWSRVLLEKLTVPLLVKKFPAFYVTRRFITAFTSSSHLSLS